MGAQRLRAGVNIIIRIFCLVVLLASFIVTPCFAGENNDIVRVGITDNKFQNVLKQQITVFGTADCDVCDKASRKVLFHIRPDTDIVITNLLSGLEVNVGGNSTILQDFVIICPSGLLGVKDLKRKGIQALYHGAFELDQTPEHSGFYLINLVELQDYLKGVVPNEMPVRFGLEALKAQAVAARNYVLTPRTQAYKEFNVVDSVASQVYFGANTESDIATRAVMETEGIVALYNNELILALYSSTAGGYTESYSNAFSEPATKIFPALSKPYLVAVPDKEDFEPLNDEEKAREFYSAKIPSYDIESPYYRWQKEWAVGELENVLKKTLVTQSKTGFVTPAFREGETLGNLKDIKIMKRGDSGKVVELDIMTTKGCYRVVKELVIRRIFQKDGVSLPSANVIFEKKFDDKGNLTDITAYGGGFGHGVGMSQFGAGYMSTKLHKPYYDILRHYYSGISLGTMPKEVYNHEVEHVFWAPIGRASIVIVGPSMPKIDVMINEKTYTLPVVRTLFRKEVKVDISRYIEDGQNKVVLYPGHFPMKAYIEVIESYNTDKITAGEKIER